ncbi:hypothetical protein SY88_20125 [Clostridiales bacterium PH28_bin88]|nr:hypothetical protein SY88_20125 [Clostridiales bacterium PH28_bin88]
MLFLTDQMIQAALSAGLLEGEAKQQHIDQAVESVAELAGLLMEVLQGKGEHLETLLYQLASQKLPDRRILESFGNFTQDLNSIMYEGLRLYRRRQVEPKDMLPQGLQVEQTAPMWIPTEPDTINTAIPESGLYQDRSEQVGKQAEEIVVQKEFSGDVEEIPVAKDRGDDHGDFVAPEKTGYAWRRSPEEDQGDAVLRTLHNLYPGEEVVKGYLFHGTFLDYFLPGVKLGIGLHARGAYRQHARLDYYCAKEGVDIYWVNREDATDLRVMTKQFKALSRRKV